MTYCRECGVTKPHHWPGCPEDTAGAGLPKAPEPRRLTVAERIRLEGRW